MSSERAQIWRVNAIVWACFLFVAGYVVVRQMRGLPPGPLIVYPLLSLGFLSVATRTYLLARRKDAAFTFTPSITLLDIFLIALGMYITGGKSSGLWLLYFPLLVSEMFTASPRDVIWMLALVVVLQWAAFLPLKTGDDYGRLFTQVFFLLLVAGFARSVNAVHVRRERELAALREKVTLADERQRIAREFHDGLGHTLVQAVLGLELARKTATRDPKSAEEILVSQSETLRQALDEMRLVVWQMQPANEIRGLVARISCFSRQLEERAGVEVTCDVPQGELNLSPAVEVMLARVVQEGLSNIAKHAENVQHVTIALRQADGRLECSVADDGGGFDLNRVIGGFGIQHMRDRIQSLGGTFSLTSHPGGGAVVKASIPIDAELGVDGEEKVRP